MFKWVGRCASRSASFEVVEVTDMPTGDVPDAQASQLASAEGLHLDPEVYVQRFRKYVGMLEEAERKRVEESRKSLIRGVDSGVMGPRFLFVTENLDLDPRKMHEAGQILDIILTEYPSDDF